MNDSRRRRFFITGSGGGCEMLRAMVAGDVFARGDPGYVHARLAEVAR